MGTRSKKNAVENDLCGKKDVVKKDLSVVEVKSFSYNGTDIGVACGKTKSVVFRLSDVCRVLELEERLCIDDHAIGLAAGRCEPESELFEYIKWTTVLRDKVSEGEYRRENSIRFVTEKGLNYLLAASAIRGKEELASNFEAWVYETLVPEARRVLRIDIHPNCQSKLPVGRSPANVVYDELRQFLDKANTALSAIAGYSAHEIWLAEGRPSSKIGMVQKPKKEVSA